MADGATRGRRAPEGSRRKQSYFSDSDSSTEGAAVPGGAAPKAELEQQAESLRRRSAELEEDKRQAESLRRRNAELEEEGQRLRARCGELEGHCGELRGRCSELEEALQKRGQELEARAAELKALRADSAALQVLRERLPAALGRARGAVASGSELARRSVAEAAQLRERERRSTIEEGERELRLRDELMTELSTLRLEDEARARALGEQLRRQQERCAEGMRQEVLRTRAEASAAAAAEEEFRRTASAAAAPGAAGTAHLEALLHSFLEKLPGLLGDREAGFAQRAPVNGLDWVSVRDAAAQTER